MQLIAKKQSWIFKWATSERGPQDRHPSGEHCIELTQFQKVGPWRALSEPTKKEKQTRHTCQGPTVGDVWRKFKIAFSDDPR
jgi:hypothetical protein